MLGQLWHIGWSGHEVQGFVERIFDVSLTDEVSEHPDSLEHVDAVQKEDEYSVQSNVEHQWWEYFQIPVQAHHEEQSDAFFTLFSIWLISPYLRYRWISLTHFLEILFSEPSLFIVKWYLCIKINLKKGNTVIFLRWKIDLFKMYRESCFHEICKRLKMKPEKLKVSSILIYHERF